VTAPTAAYERNREPILQVLKQLIKVDIQQVLEVGSGTGHHAVYFASHFPHLAWTTSELSSEHPAIQETLREANQTNVHGPIEFEIGKTTLPLGDFDLVFSANVLHIITELQVRQLIQTLGACLKSGAQILFYGPFNYGGQFTSEGNRDFDAMLKSVSPHRGIRNFEDICEWMKLEHLLLKQDFEMPSNNRLLHFEKI
jgi:cyclopropane fatty-acyl-phospholipid synthase-like methyltransferase